MSIFLFTRYIDADAAAYDATMRLMPLRFIFAEMPSRRHAFARMILHYHFDYFRLLRHAFLRLLLPPLIFSRLNSLLTAVSLLMLLMARRLPRALSTLMPRLPVLITLTSFAAHTMPFSLMSAC